MTELVSSLLDLRILVLTLGETHHNRWWRSQFLSHTGLSFLERIYPRSAFAAAVRSAIRAARDIHDASIGKGDVHHLFRLQPGLERAIDRYLGDENGRLQETFKPILMERETLLSKLHSLTEDMKIELLVGPVRVSVAGQAFVPALAAIYLSAIRHNKQVFPYLEQDMQPS